MALVAPDPPPAPSGPNTKTAPAPSQPTAPPPSAAASSDWTSDPIYQLTVAQENLAIAQAKAEALKEETQAVIAYGDYNLALAITGDKNIALAARNNKTSTIARLAAQNQQNVQNTNEAENQSNLFYSSDRGKQLGLAQQAYLNNSADALTAVHGQVNTISQNLLAAEQQAYLAEQQAAQASYNRAVANPPGISTPTPDTSQVPGLQNLPQGGYNVAGFSQGTSFLAPGATAPWDRQTRAATYPVSIKANPTGGSANVRQGVFSIH